MTSVNAEASTHIADWLMSVFVNELAPPHARSQQGQCVQQCRRIMKETLAERSTNAADAVRVIRVARALASVPARETSQ